MMSRSRAALPPEVLAAFFGPDAASAIKEAAAETGPVPYTLTLKALAALTPAEAVPGPVTSPRIEDPEAGPGHDYDGPELHPGTPEYGREYADYLAWVAANPGPRAEPEPEAEA